MVPEIVLDGLRLPVESPLTVAAYAARVRELIASGLAVYPIGGGTGLEFGTPPSRPGVALSLAHLKRIVDYPVRDLTVTVEAGMTVGDLQRLLAAQNQRLPIDVPDADRATVGGAISTNAFGPRRLSCGTFRDHIIGITVVNDNGELCSAGGRVVKNVAGYDLAKLYTRALGTLGVIVQVTMKLQPTPPVSVWIVAPVAAAQLATTLDHIHNSATRPAAVDLFNANAAGSMSDTSLPQGDFVLAALFEDNAEAVEWQIAELAAETQLSFKRIAAPGSFERQIVDSPAVAGCDFSILATTRPSVVAEMLSTLNGSGTRLHAAAMSGILRIGLLECQFEAARQLHRETLEISTKSGGNAVIRRCETAWKAHLHVWGQQPSALSLMHRVKQQFDPRDLFNPGRHC